MILYDANPQVVKSLPLAKFEGNRITDKDVTVFQSFSRAKNYARKSLNYQIKELQHKLLELEEITEENCEEISNPFG